MAQEAVVIPEKIYFKIGEVCELVGVQAHVLRYWETEFSTLSPQKNKSGQRSYRRRDVEIALRIKQLLYNEMFTIAGARKKLQLEIREGSKPKEQPAPPPVQTEAQILSQTVPSAVALGPTGAPLLFDAGFETEADAVPTEIKPLSAMLPAREYTRSQKDAIRILADHLLDLREMLKNSQVS
ncbi:MAG: MerR family transcriptional regulator [Pyrinomonadaceae bacterium]